MLWLKSLHFQYIIRYPLCKSKVFAIFAIFAIFPAIRKSKFPQKKNEKPTPEEFKSGH